MPSGDHDFVLNFAATNPAQWQAIGPDPTSIFADPQFAPDPAGNDYLTQPGSPARDAAIPIPGYTVPPCPGSTAPNPPDIGFWEAADTDSAQPPSTGAAPVGRPPRPAGARRGVDE